MMINPQFHAIERWIDGQTWTVNSIKSWSSRRALKKHLKMTLPGVCAVREIKEFPPSGTPPRHLFYRVQRYYEKKTRYYAVHNIRPFSPSIPPPTPKERMESGYQHECFDPEGQRLLSLDFRNKVKA